MAETVEICTVCLRPNESLTRASENDDDNTNFYTKLTLCIPAVIWSETDLICPRCVGTLDTVDKFRKLCIHSDELKREQQQRLEEQRQHQEENASHENTANSIYASSLASIPTVITDAIESADIKPKIAASEAATMTNVFKPLQSLGEFTCHLCNDKFEHKVLLLKHLKVHQKKHYECEQCGQSFPGVRQLQSHVRSEHIGAPKGRKFVCDFCGESFRWNKQLIEHAILEHKVDPKSIKQFRCDECDSKFLRASHLKRHKKYHEGTRTYCSKGFITQTDLQKQHRKRDYKFSLKSSYEHVRHHSNHRQFTKHLRTHSSERTFKCGQCGRAYKDKELLRIHLVKMHGVVKVPRRKRKHTCEVCTKAFSDKSKLRKHTRTHSKAYVHDVVSETNS